MPLNHWEDKFDARLRSIPEDERGKAGAILAVIPSRDDWEHFVAEVRIQWSRWEWTFSLKPACLTVLYDGVAFYNYRSGAFWKGFAEVVGTAVIPVNTQTAINRSYMRAALRYGFPVTQGSFVGSAVAHIGVPISMWDAFLHICEWALWTSGWDALSENAWQEAMSSRLGGQARLINFLVENRSTATQFIREMLDAREVLSADRRITVSEIAQALILRPEYFEEVPETADFLRPNDPESLFADRARLAWCEERQTISLHLPPVHQDSLPAVWRLEDCEKQAARTALEFSINGGAFGKTLRLQLASNDSETQQRIAGIDGWALYDEARLRFVNHLRDVLPVSQYTLISRHRLAPQLDGWQHDPEDPRVDIESNLTDGTPVFLTKLFAESRRPKLKIGNGDWIKFAQRRGVSLRIFCGETPRAAARMSLSADGTIRSELWPQPFLEVPLSLVHDDDVADEFAVFLDGQPAQGKWLASHFDPEGVDQDEAERGFYFWRWDAMPIPQTRPPTVTHRTLSSIDASTLKPASVNWCGLHTLHVQSRRIGRLMFGSKTQCDFELLPPLQSDAFWPPSWDDYTAWLLLSQVQDEATWDEVMIAREAVAGFTNVDLRLLGRQIHKLEQHGHFARRGHRYINFSSRITLANAPGGTFHGEYCGLTSSLYELVRKMPPLTLAASPSEAGRPTKLHIEWLQRDRHDVRNACQHAGIKVVQQLWNHH